MRRKPLKVITGAQQPIPLGKIHRSIAGARVEFPGLDWRRKPREFDAAERELIRSLFESFSIDASQHTFEVVQAVYTFLWISFGDDDCPVPPTFDWRLIDEISEAQMVATFALVMLFISKYAKPKGTDFYRLVVNAHTHVAALRQALQARESTRHAALVMRQVNPAQAAIQAAKALALNLWKERRAGKHPKLRTNEQFATECMRRWPVLTSSAVITGWCTEWNKAAKAGKS